MLRFLAVGVMVTGVVMATGCAPAAVERPNVVIFLADDQGWGDLSIHGNSNLQTPNIDKLAEEGAIFDRFFVSAVCAPTRAEFLTGRYHLRGGVMGVSTGQERLNLDEVTIGDTFQAAGKIGLWTKADSVTAFDDLTMTSYEPE